jgi:hypothetical protein
MPRRGARRSFRLARNGIVRFRTSFVDWTSSAAGGSSSQRTIASKHGRNCFLNSAVSSPQRPHAWPMDVQSMRPFTIGGGCRGMTRPTRYDLVIRCCARFFSGLLPDEGARQRLAGASGLSAGNAFRLLEVIGANVQVLVTLSLRLGTRTSWPTPSRNSQSGTSG